MKLRNKIYTWPDTELKPCVKEYRSVHAVFNFNRVCVQHWFLRSDSIIDLCYKRIPQYNTVDIIYMAKTKFPPLPKHQFIKACGKT